MASKQSISFPTPFAGRFVRYTLGFGVSVAVGMAPFLGKIKVPGFDALLGLFPVQLQEELIPLSAFLMGLVSLVVQFYYKEEIAVETLRRYFRIVVILLVIVFFVFVVLYAFFVEHVSGKKLFGSAIVTSSRQTAEEGCECNPKWSNKKCLANLSVEPEAVEACWGGNALKVRKLFLEIPYLLIMSGFGVLVGLFLLKPPPTPGTGLPKAVSRLSDSGESSQAEAKSSTKNDKESQDSAVED